MRYQLVLVCVALCVAFTMGKPVLGRNGKKGSGEKPGKGGCTSVCSLTNQTSSTEVTVQCKDGFQCISGLLDFYIRADKFSASFCVHVEDEEESAETTTAAEAPIQPLLDAEPQPVDNEKYIKFLLRRACSIINGTSGEERTRRCPRNLNCSLEAVGVEDDGHFLTATYCQDDEQAADWMEVFNGRRRRGDSSEEEDEEDVEEESSEEESGEESDEEGDEDSSEEEKDKAETPTTFGRFRKGRGRESRRQRRDVRKGVRVGACNITDANGAEIESAACLDESACTVGPVVADDNGATINIFFCERPEKSSEESSEEEDEDEDETDLEDDEVEEEEDEDENEDEEEEEEMDDDDEEEVFDHIARKMFCNACSLTSNGTDVDVRVTCPTCTAGPLSIDINGTEVVATFCQTDEDFSLIQALQCHRKKGGKGGKGRRLGANGGLRRREGRNGQKGAKRGVRV